MTSAALQTARALVFVLPWPPSVNQIWRRVETDGGTRTLRSKGGNAYRESGALQLMLQQVPRHAPTHQVQVDILAQPPDKKRRRDLDNLLKAPLDLLVYCGVIADDSQIMRLSIEWGESTGKGQLCMTINPWGGH